MAEERSGTAALPPESVQQIAANPTTELPRESATGGSPRRGRTASAGSTISLEYGRRKLRAYPITEGELRELAGIGGLATVAFAIGSGAIGFAINIYKDLELNPGVAQNISVFWDAVRGISLITGVLLLLGGVALMIWGRTRLGGIKRNTQFDVT